MESTLSRRVLIVDPDPSVRILMQACLRREGYQVDMAADVEEALSLRKQGRHGAVVLEPRIPGGASLLVALSTFDHRARPRLVIVTTPDNSAPDFSRAPGVRSVLYKPFEIRALSEAIADCCDGDN